MNPKKKAPTLSPQERVEKFRKEETKLLEKYALEKRLAFVFPASRGVPVMGRLARLFLKWSGGKIEIGYVNKK